MVISYIRGLITPLIIITTHEPPSRVSGSVWASLGQQDTD